MRVSIAEPLPASGAYADAASRTKDPDKAFRARFFQILTRRASSGPDEFDSVLSDFRALAAEATGTRWGRLAGLYADEMSQANTLRWALQRAGADVVKLQAQIETTQSELDAAKQTNTEQAATVQSLTNERAQLQRTIHDLEDQVAERAAVIDALQAELDALKKIDLSRVP